MPRRNEISISLTRREVREFAEWLRRAKPNERCFRTVLTDEASELLRRIAIEDQFDKAGRRKRVSPHFNMPLTREHARLLIRCASRPSPLWMGGPFVQRIDPQAPKAVQRVARSCMEALNKRRGNPKKRLLTRNQVESRVTKDYGTRWTRELVRRARDWD
jgi:hypothetical protein